MSLDLSTLKVKTEAYKQVLKNTDDFRKEWKSGSKSLIQTTLKYLLKELKIKGEVKTQENVENLESVILDLGKASSGITENLEGSGVKRTMIKTNGSLVYQQLFNGKIMVMVSSPHIEGYGEPNPPFSLEILRPSELEEGFILRHFEQLLKAATEWEDYDDDLPTQQTRSFNPIGFNGNDTFQDLEDA
jgi:hypothetical protein